MDKLISVIYYSIIHGLKLALTNFDPSLFQNIVLGILAIFIPFVIVFLTNINSKNQRSDLEKSVLIKEIFGPKRIFVLSVIGIIFFSFFAGKDIPIENKAIAFLLGIILVILFMVPFNKILKFSEGYTTEFEYIFLKKLKFSEFFKIGNSEKGVEMVKVWESFWSEYNMFDEKRFFEIYSSNIDRAFKLEMFDVAIQLSQTLLSNIEKRNYFIVYNEILSKILEWDELLWNEEQKWHKRYNKDKKLNDIFNKYLPTFKKWLPMLFNRKKINHFWRWNYFNNEFLPKITDLMLTTDQEAFPFFDGLKKHVHQCEIKLNTIANSDNKARYWAHISRLVSGFTSVFYNKITLSASSYFIWKDCFPEEWKTISANSNNNISRLILGDFLKWAQERVMKNNKEEFDANLSDVINGLFPNVDSTFFPVFLLWYLLYDLRNALAKKKSFHILSVSIFGAGEMSEEKIEEAFRKKEKAKKEETINIVINYFSYRWTLLQLYDSDLTDKERTDWQVLSEEEKKSIVKKIRINKLQTSKKELEGAEIIKLCEQDSSYENKRVVLIEFVNSLLESLSK